MKIRVPSVGVLTEAANNEPILLTYHADSDLVHIHYGHYTFYLAREFMPTRIKLSGVKYITCQIGKKVTLEKEVFENFLHLAKMHREKFIQSQCSVQSAVVL